MIDFADDAEESEADFPLGDGVADTSATVDCPWCGEDVAIGLDPGSGTHQCYVEDCSVCCRPLLVHVDYDEDGRASVFAVAEGE